MLANLLIQPGKTAFREIETPKPSHGEILVKIKTALTCGTDLKAFRRGHPMIPMPGVFGHEFSGIVAGVGRGVKKFKEGDRIMSVHSAPCLECGFCRKRLYNLCEKIMSTKVLGAFAEYILLPPHIAKQNAFHMPDNITFEEAAFLEPLSCVVHSVASAGIREGDIAIVIGAGPIGLLHLLLLKEKGAIVAVMDKHNSKIKTAKKLGADFVFLASPAESSSGKGRQGGIFRMNKINGFVGFDYLFECTGMPEVWASSVEFVRRGGTVMLFGGCRSGTTVTYATGRLHYDEITLKGVFHFTPSDVRKAYNLLCEKRLGVSRLISGRYPLNKVRKAFDKLSKGRGIKYAIIP